MYIKKISTRSRRLRFNKFKATIYPAVWFYHRHTYIYQHKTPIGGKNSARNRRHYIVKLRVEYIL